MPAFRTTRYWLISLGLFAAGSVVLTGCSLGSILRGVKTDYKLQGVDNDQETASYLQTIMDERLVKKTQTLVDKDEDPELRSRQESFIEQTIRTDLLKALAARGYYAASVSFIDGQAPLSGHYDIHYGPQYKISSFLVSPSIYSSALPENAPARGDILDAEKTLKAQSALQNNIGKDHCYFDLSVENRVHLDPNYHTGKVELLADAGREGHFGPLTFENRGKVKESYLKLLAPWHEGDCFRREKLETYKTALLQSGLFSQANIILPENGPAADGSVPVTLALKERARRTISSGLTYYSDEGLGGVLGWEHRNFFGAAEKLKATLSLSTLKQSLETDFNKPYFLRKDQSLSLNAAIRRQDTDAFEELAIDTGGSITRTFGHKMSGTTGINMSLLRIDDTTQNTSDTYGLLSAPQTLTYDTRDNSLDPKKGINLALTAEPFFDLLGQADPFFKTQFTGSSYLAFNPNNILALKASLGSIWGAEIDAIPATERFYAGGGGSVRGYGYQEVGPQENGAPTGGRSIATMSLEFRSKFTDTLGGVAFIDAGSIGEDSTPSFNQMSVGTGLGLRYYTSFGPLRFDIATPLTEKNNTDQNYQFYISIGQAF